jgi:hypothetical protein
VTKFVGVFGTFRAPLVSQHALLLSLLSLRKSDRHQTVAKVRETEHVAKFHKHLSKQRPKTMDDVAAERH